MQRDECASAAQLFSEALQLEDEMGDRLDIAYLLQVWAALAMKTSKPQLAVRLYAAAQSLREALQVTVTRPQAAEWEAGIAAARKQLGGKVFESEWAAGAGMTLEEVIAELLSKV